jgi:hypothetical protein
VSVRVARSRELVAQGRSPSLVARVAGISRQAIYRRPARPPKGQRRALDAADRIVLDIARANPTDGTRMVAALVVVPESVVVRASLKAGRWETSTEPSRRAPDEAAR